MPTYSSLRAQGTRFTHAFVPSPLCAPSRACLAGGREYDAAGVPDNFNNNYPLNETTFYTLLRASGYTVMATGKDDLTKATGPGINGSFHAAELGFSSWARCDGKQDAAGATPHDPYGAWCAARSELVDGVNLSYWQIYNRDMRSCTAAKGASNGYDCQAASPLPQAAYEDDWVAAHAVQLLASAPPGAPWFLQVNFPGPHPPFVVTGGMQNTTSSLTFPLAADNPALSPAVQQTVRRDYAAELVNLDALFARVLAAIPASDQPNTVIVLASDHGEMLGDHGDWGKEMPWGGSINVPLVILGPGLPANATFSEPVATMDLAGTILELAGLRPDTANGMSTRSLLPLLAPSPNASAYRGHVSSGLGKWRAVAMTRPSGKRLKLICCAPGPCPGQPGNATHAGQSGWVGDGGEVAAGGAAAYPRALLQQAQQAQQQEEGSGGGGGDGSTQAASALLLFDLDADPFDMNDLAQSMPESLKDMRKLLPDGWCH